MKNKEKYKLAFKNIKLNDDVERKIWNKIENRNKCSLKYACILFTIIIITISGGLCIANADEIKDSFINLTAKIRIIEKDKLNEIDTGEPFMYKKTNFDNHKLPLKEKPKPGWKVYGYEKSDVNILDAEKDEYIGFSNEIYCKNSDDPMQGSAYLNGYVLTKNAKIEYLRWIIYGDIIDEERIALKYHIKSLNVDGIIIKFSSYDNEYRLDFFYDNTRYFLEVYNTPIEELINIAESLHY